ncbi:hypothetical protein N431DRAFT_465661 [Stipitochalara longipes BDJ]|nr:hypothetical protein N431DRAFT_465661 [Stipitochalara longipes BDJ]
MSASDPFHDDQNTFRNTEEHYDDAEEREAQFSEPESTERSSRVCSRSQSPNSLSNASREEAAGKLEDARRKINEKTEKRRASQEAQRQRARPRLVEKSRTTGTAGSNSNSDEITTSNISVPAVSRLGENKWFRPFMVPPGRETPLREVVTKHQSANEIRRPQSKISIVENQPEDAPEDEK